MSHGDGAAPDNASHLGELHVEQVMEHPGGSLRRAERLEHQPSPVMVNGAPGLAVLEGDACDFVISLTLKGDRISRVDIIRAPDKLAVLGEAF